MNMQIPTPSESEQLIMLLEQHRDILKDSDIAIINGKEYSTQSMAFKDIMKGFEEAVRFARLIKASHKEITKNGNGVRFDGV